MRLSFGITSNQPLEQIREISRLANAMEKGHVWIGEDIGGRYDIYTLLAILKKRMQNVCFGIGITSPLYHNITTIARASTLLTEIGEGQFRLGLGVGGLKELKERGITIEKPHEMLSEGYNLLHQIWERNTIQQITHHYRLIDYSPKLLPANRIPIFFGIRGPRLLHLAGEIADGVILSGPKSYLTQAVQIVEQGRKEVNHKRKFTTAIWNPTYITQTPDDTHLIKRITAFIIADMPRSVLAMTDLEAGQVESIRADVIKRDIAGASQKIDDSLLRSFGIYGAPEEVCTEMRSFENLSADEVIFGPPYGKDWKTAVKSIIKTWERS